MRLSIIICAYNTESAYIDTCLTSVFHSTLAKEEFEVVFVDDGSTRDYSALVSKYPLRYFKIKNSGALRARFFGAKQAHGEYLAFVDSDDKVSMNYYRPMLDAAKLSGADIVFNGWAFMTGRSCRTCINDSTMAQDICIEGTDVLPFFVGQQGREHSYYVNWNKIYRRTLIVRTADTFETLGLLERRIEFAEDALFNFFNFKEAQKVVSVNSGFYFYRIHAGQISKENSIERLWRHIDCMAQVLDTMVANIGSHQQAERIKADVDEWRSLMARSHYQVALSLKSTEIEERIKEMYYVNRLERPRCRDGIVYENTELLGNNFEEIDRQLSLLYESCTIKRASFERKCRWISRIIQSTGHWTGRTISYLSKAEIGIPKRSIQMRDALIHNPLVYRVGTRLFKKGSKMRAFLKRVL